MTAKELESALPKCGEFFTNSEEEKLCNGKLIIIKTIKINHKWICECNHCLRIEEIERTFDSYNKDHQNETKDN